MPNFPDITPRSDLERVAKDVTEYQLKIAREQARRLALTDAQRLAERLFFEFDTDPNSGWYYEDWKGYTHRKWLTRAQHALKTIPDPEKAFEFVRMTMRG